MARYAILDEIKGLDPQADHERIVHLTACYEFPFDMTRALEFALFRTYCVPSVSALLARTGEFEARPQKRYDDTDIIISEMMEHGYSSPRGERALARMNQIHGRFRIANEDFLYVLSTFVFEPIRWIDRYAWRPMCGQERLAMFHFWREVGRRMGIEDLPQDYGRFDAFNRAFERDHYRYSDTNRRIGEATVALFASWFPAPVRPAVRSSIRAMLDDPLIEAFGFPRPPPLMRRTVRSALGLRGYLSGWLPRRSSPRLRSAMRRPSYPCGHTIERLGPPDPH
ncbi:MAG: oxygenase MpaB family protein [Hyphomicrobiales bacterium]